MPLIEDKIEGWARRKLMKNNEMRAALETLHQNTKRDVITPGVVEPMIIGGDFLQDRKTNLILSYRNVVN